MSVSFPDFPKNWRGRPGNEVISARSSNLLLHLGTSNSLVSESTRSEVSKSSGYEVALAAFGTFLVSLDLYLILSRSMLCRNLSGDWINRIVSIIFSVLLVAMCVESALVSGPWPLSYIGGTNTVAHTDVLISSLGFYAYEVCLWVRWWWLGIERTYKKYIFHHLVCVASFLRLLYQNKCGPEAMTLLCLSEATVPLLQVYWCLRESGSYEYLKDIVTCVYTGLFCTIRLIVFAVLLLKYYLSCKFDILFILVTLCFYFINVHSCCTWIRRVYEIIKKCFKL